MILIIVGGIVGGVVFVGGVYWCWRRSGRYYGLPRLEVGNGGSGSGSGVNFG